MINQRLVLAIAFVVTESLTLFVIGAVLAGAGDHYGLAFPGFVAAELGGFALVKAALRIELPHRVLIAAGGLLSFVALVTIAGLAIDPGSFPPGWSGVLRFPGDPGGTLKQLDEGQVFGVLLLIVAWARGLVVAQRRLERGTALRTFSIGVIVLVFALLFSQDSSAKGAVDGASIPLVAAGLLTLTLIHLRDARPGDTGLRGLWVSISVGTVGALVLGGAALGVLPLGPLGFVYDRLFRVGPIYRYVFNPLLDFVLLAIVWVITVITFPFVWLIGLLVNYLVGHPVENQIPPSDQSQQNQNLAQKGHTAAWIVLLAKVIIVAVVIAVIAYIAYRLFRRLHRPLDDDEDREALQHDGSVRADLLSLLRGLRPRRAARAGAPPEPKLPAGVLEVRRLYLRLLSLSAARGRIRPEGETPHEFLPEAAAVVPAPEAGDLTAAFVQARYGLAEPSAGRIAQLREELQRAEHERPAGRA